MKKGIMGESLVFVISTIAVIALIIVFFIVLKVSGKFENVIKEEKLNEQSLMILDLLKTKLPSLDEFEKAEKISISIETEKNTAFKVLKENEILWKEKTYTDFLAELYNSKIDVVEKNHAFKLITYSLLEGMNNIRISVEYPNFIAQIDIGEMKYSLDIYPMNINIPLEDKNFVKVSWYGAEK